MRGGLLITAALASFGTELTAESWKAGGPDGPRVITLTEAPVGGTTSTTSTLPPASAYPYPYPYPNGEHNGGMYLKADPTLSPDRGKNFVPLPSAAEAKFMRFGPSPPPDRGSGMNHGCVWQPGFYGCDCKEIILGCREATSTCEMELQKEEMTAPEAARRHFMATFDRTDLNALQTKLHARLRGRQPTASGTAYDASTAYANFDGPKEGVGFPVDGYPWGKTDFFSKLAKMGEEPQMPNEFGHQLFDDPPDWESVIRGKCTLEEMKAIESCMSYFYGCHKNYEQLHEWRTNAVDVTNRYLEERLQG